METGSKGIGNGVRKGWVVESTGGVVGRSEIPFVVPFEAEGKVTGVVRGLGTSGDSIASIGDVGEL